MKRRRATQAERTRAFAKAGNVTDLEDLIHNRMPVDAKFQADLALREALKVWLDATWHRHKGGKA